jgi:hypothetical protein
VPIGAFPFLGVLCGALHLMGFSGLSPFISVGDALNFRRIPLLSQRF